MPPVLRAIAVGLLTLFAPPVGAWAAGLRAVSIAWFVVPLWLASAPLLITRVLAGIAVVHDLVLLAIGVAWIALVVLTAVRAARRAPTMRSWQLVAGAVAYIVCTRLLILGPSFFVDRIPVHTGGMAPSLVPGDTVWVIPAGSDGPRIDVGDIVQVHVRPERPDGSKGDARWIRRVIALEGQRVSVQDHTVFVDGVALPTQPSTREVHPSLDAECRPISVPTARMQLGERSVPIIPGISARSARAPEVVVPPGHVYLLGDSRDRAMDSRRIGPVPVSSIESTVVAVANPISLSPCARIQFGRVGAVP